MRNESDKALSNQYYTTLKAYTIEQSEDPSTTATKLITCFYENVPVNTNANAAMNTSPEEGGDPYDDINRTDEIGSDVEGSISILWALFLDIVIQIPYDHPDLERLVRLLSAIKTHAPPTAPPLQDDTMIALNAFQRSWGQHFWQNLPAFGLNLREITDCRLPLDQEQFSPNYPLQAYTREEWASISAFQALITLHGVMDLTHTGKWVVDLVCKHKEINQPQNSWALQRLTLGAAVWILKLASKFRWDEGWNLWKETFARLATLDDPSATVYMEIVNEMERQ
ncbi:hypothetical protein B7463_g10571, partial [Scytalidium lignicola]